MQNWRFILKTFFFIFYLVVIAVGKYQTESLFEIVTLERHLQVGCTFAVLIVQLLLSNLGNKDGDKDRHPGEIQLSFSDHSCRVKIKYSTKINGTYRHERH